MKNLLLSLFLGFHDGAADVAKAVAASASAATTRVEGLGATVVALRLLVLVHLLLL
jgi:hypothetical protein